MNPVAAPASRWGSPGRVWLCLAALLALWFLPGLWAAQRLLAGFRLPTEGVALHGLLLLALLLAVLLPFMADVLKGQSQALQRWLLAGLLASVQAGMLLFYALHLLGQQNWGNWMNWQLLQAYARQLPGLMVALEIPAALLGLGSLLLVLVWAAGVAAYAVLLKPLLRPGVSPLHGLSAERRPAAGLLVLLLMLLSLLVFYQSYGRDRETWRNELIWQSRLSDGFGEAGQGEQVSSAQLLRDREVIRNYHPAAPTRARPLVLIIVDALRSDQMGVYGGPVDNTPFLSGLMRQGQLQRIESAYSVCTVSYCGILGTLSSKYWHQITPQPWNIADALKRVGYESRFLLSGDHTSYYGMRKMYGESLALMRDGSDAAGVAGAEARYSNDDRAVLDQLDATAWPQKQAGFLYIHLMSAHRLGLVESQFKRWHAQDAPAWSPYAAVDARQDGQTRARYHNGILQTDEMIRQIFLRLQKLQVLDDALVVITADHGEYLGEYGHWSHGYLPYEPAVRIPLLVYDRAASTPWPARALVSQVDIAPTFLHAIGVPPPAHWSGTALQVASERSALVLESAESSGVVSIDGGGRYKFLRLHDGTEQLFELRPGGAGEADNLAGLPGQRERLLRMRQTHQRLTTSPTEAGP